MDKTAGLYIHIPFCRRKCTYCDFNSYSRCESLFAPYLHALHQEMAHCVSHWRESVAQLTCRTLYIGGGTPTVLPAADLCALVRDARSTFSLPQDAEITVEANPGTVDKAALRDLLAAGVNRLSLGVQSLDPVLLRTMGRIHDAEQARRAVRDARAAGLDNLNLDLIFGLPGQTLAGWKQDLEGILALSPDHLSLYALTVEDGTPLAVSIHSGSLPDPDPDLAAEMYEWAEKALSVAGWVHYEISNWAQPGRACQHNLIYWRNEPYIGLGAGAHSSSGRDEHVWQRWSNLSTPQDYIAALESGQSAVAGTPEAIGRPLEMAETMIMGLRLLQEGVSAKRFQQRFGVSLDEAYPRQIRDLVDRGLLERLPDCIRLTARGHLLGNQVFVEFL